MTGSYIESNASHVVGSAEQLSIRSIHRESSLSISDTSIGKTDRIPDDNLYSADAVYEEKKWKKLPDIPLESEKKKQGYEDAPVEEPGPPPYFPPTPVTEAVERPLWKRKWFLLGAIGILCLLIITLVVSLGVVLSKRSKNKGGDSESSSGSSGTSGNSSTSTASPTSNPTSLPTSVAHSGNAAPPLRNTAISVITIPGIRETDVPLVQIFFQDQEYYLCSKISTSGVEDWPVADSGTRIFLALNSTPISVVHEIQASYNFLPVRVFFINPQGYLADIYKSTWGGPWVNGSLSNRQFQVGDQQFGIGSNSISAKWCDFVTVYAQGTDDNLYAFQLSGADHQGNGGTWEIVWHVSGVGDITATNIASTCHLADSSVLFVNSFGGLADTGRLVTWFNSTNVTVPFPSSVSNLYRPDTPIATVYYSSNSNHTLYLFFPLPASLSSLSPNPSLHYITATPYWSSRALMDGCYNCWYATEARMNWNDTTLVDTGVVPYARGSAALFTGDNMSADNGVVMSMPRAWTPLLVKGGKDAGRILMVYLDDEMAIRVADVVGGSGNYLIINGSSSGYV